MKTKHLALSALSAAMLMGCASKPTAESLQRDQLKAEELRAKADAAKAEKRQVQNEAFIEGIPSWALQPPKPDSGGFYAVGAAESQSLSVAQKKAMLDAEFGLAKQYRQELSGSERSFTQERNDQSLSNQYTQLIDKLVSRVPVVGFEVVKQEAKSIQGTFHSWVLLKLPFAQFNRVLQEQRAEAVDVTVQKAFDDLERRLKERAAERAQEQRDQQALRQSEVASHADMTAQVGGKLEGKTVANDAAVSLKGAPVARSQVAPVEVEPAGGQAQP
ncbi:hypothetical protein [Rhodoferax sp. GW822-FHT02A01]|uniref:hypothetical protein n=1 Tax=Rhodoferax sp. GW822-FHT02A01 TaxID=3141537 RepID=UPI00315CF843